MNIRTLVISLALIVIFASGASAADRCANCRMKTKDDSRASVTMKMKDGTARVECCLYCATMEKAREADSIAGMSVKDYLTGEETSAEAAVWVEGSDAPKVMGDRSRVAFKDMSSAEGFIKEHGGKIVSFDEAFDSAQKEWKKR